MLRLQGLLGIGGGLWAPEKTALAALRRQEAGFAAAAAAAAAAQQRRHADLLVVHPAASPRHSLQEAIRLAESLEGGCLRALWPCGCSWMLLLLLMPPHLLACLCLCR